MFNTKISWKIIEMKTMKRAQFLMKKKKQLSNLLLNHLHFLSMLILLDAPLDLLYLVSQMNKNLMVKDCLAHRTMISRLTIIFNQTKIINHNLTNFKDSKNMILIKMIKFDLLVNSVWMACLHNLIMNQE